MRRQYLKTAVVSAICGLCLQAFQASAQRPAPQKQAGTIKVPCCPGVTLANALTVTSTAPACPDMDGLNFTINWDAANKQWRGSTATNKGNTLYLVFGCCDGFNTVCSGGCVPFQFGFYVSCTSYDDALQLGEQFPAARGGMMGKVTSKAPFQYSAKCGIAVPCHECGGIDVSWTIND